MRKMILTLLVLSSLQGYAQMASIANASCSGSDFNFIDATNNFSLCIPKHYLIRHTGHGVIFEDTANANSQIILESVTNAKNKTVTDWTTSMQGILAKSSPSAVFTTSPYNIGTGIGGQRLLAKYSDGGESNIIFVPLAKDNSTILMLMYIEYPNSKSIKDILFGAEALLMSLSFKWLM